MDELLSRFGNTFGKPMVSVRRASGKCREDVAIMLKDTLDDGFKLYIVDRSLNPIKVSPEEFNGTMADFIKLYNELGGNDMRDVD